ncbi:hypothetical protein ACPC54_07670 [Kitasatospora sp. NPDC094028]
MAGKPPRWYFSFGGAYSRMAYRDPITSWPDVAEAIDRLPGSVSAGRHRMAAAGALSR